MKFLYETENGFVDLVHAHNKDDITEAEIFMIASQLAGESGLDLCTVLPSIILPQKLGHMLMVWIILALVLHFSGILIFDQIYIIIWFSLFEID